MLIFNHIIHSAPDTSARWQFITAAKPKKDKTQMTDQIPEMQLVEKRKLKRQTRTLCATDGEPSVAMMLSGVLEAIRSGDVTTQHVEVASKMMDLYERNEKRQAEKDFAAALTELQGETIRVQATKAVDVKNGVPRYTFAPYEEIMRTVQPMLTRHGFSVTFDTKIDGDRLYSVCTLTHKAGHSRSNQFAVRFGKPPGSSDAQGDMSTKSYAKRGALCDALNISIDHDDDARMIGKPIGKALAEELRARVIRCSNEDTFLKYAGVQIEPGIAPTFDDYAKISEDRYPVLDELLKRKEAKL